MGDLMRFFLISFVFSLSFISHASHAAFDLSPIVANVTPSGASATTSFTVTNADDTKTPVQISIVHRLPDIDGNERFDEVKDASDMFQIFPAQLILNPKEKRTVRVTYVGDPKLKQELALRIIAEEFPISVSDPAKVKNRAVASIAIATKYVGSLYVTPTGTKPDIQIEGMPAKGKNGNDMVLTFENKGTEHQILKQVTYKVVAGGKEYVLPPEALKQIGSQNILAGKSRRVAIPWPSSIPLGPVKVTFEVAKK
jgi:fimbrial chaperone protein